MTEEEIIKMVIDEITECRLGELREAHNEEYDKLTAEISALSGQMQAVLSELPAESAEVIDGYIAKTSALADKDCAYLYEQGAIDCVRLLKKLGVL